MNEDEQGVRMHWINDRDVYCRCPACGWVFPKGTEKLNVCPHCGAKMDKEEKMKKELVNELLEYYNENGQDFNHDIIELDDWNGCLGDKRIIPMDKLNEYFSDPQDVLIRAYFGHDKDSDGKLFNPLREYFYSENEKLVSTDEEDYSDFLDENKVVDIIDNEERLYLSDGAREIIDKYED